jgi:uncharacterized iron-regulated membrane protein
VRSALLVFHRWLALIIGVLLILIAVSGAGTVFEGRIAESNAVHVVPGGQVMSLDVLAARSIAAAGGGQVAAISIGRAPSEAFGFEVDRDTVENDLMINPYTGAVLGRAPPPTRLILIATRLHQFHTSLLAGSTGRLVVGFVTIGALILVLSGLFLWWREKLWRIQWSASWKRIAFDLHHTFGAAAAIVLLIITGTGVWIGFPNQVNPMVLRLNRTALPNGQPKAPPPDSGATPVSFDSLVESAHSAVPGAPVLLLLVPPTGPVTVFLRYPEDHTPGGRSRVYLDRYRGTVLRATNTRTAEPGTKLMNLERSLHTGDVLGGLTQVIWFLASLVLASQAVTGIMMWWNGRAGRKAVRARG